MTILQLQRRIMEAGRIRIGQQVPTGNGKSRPAKLDTFRITSADRARIDAIAHLYGGTPREWDAPAGKQWEVVTEADALPIIVPPSDMAFSQWYESWSAGGCQRRCDGATEQLTDQPCICDPDERDCDIHTRLSVMLRDVPGLGVYRLDTQGYYAAVELQGAIEVVQMAAARGAMIPARLRLEQRQTKRPGQGTRRFAVPVIDLEVSPAQLLGGQAGAMQLGTVASAAPALEAGEPAPAEPPALLTPVPPTVEERPVQSVAAQAAQAGRPAATKRAGAAAAIPRTGLAPRTAAQAAAGAEPERGEPEGVQPLDELETLTVAQLKLRLKRAELPVSGSKQELIDRLRAQETAGSEISKERKEDGHAVGEERRGSTRTAPGEARDEPQADPAPEGRGTPPQEAPPPPEDDSGEAPTHTFDRAAAQRAFHAQLHELGLDYETQVRPWMADRLHATLSELDDSGLSKILDAMDARPREFVAAVEAHQAPQHDEAAAAGPTPAERAHARAEGAGDRLKTLQERIRAAFRVLAVHDHTIYQGGWERLEKITDGRASSADWDGASTERLQALANDMERAADAAKATADA